MRQTGRMTLKVNGDVLATGENGATMTPGGPMREDGMTDQDEHFYKERSVPAEFTATLIHVAGTDIDALRNMVDGVITFETDTGQVWSSSGAITKEIGELSQGELPVTFGGKPAVRVA